MDKFIDLLGKLKNKSFNFRESVDLSLNMESKLNFKLSLDLNIQNSYGTVKYVMLTKDLKRVSIFKEVGLTNIMEISNLNISKLKKYKLIFIERETISKFSSLISSKIFKYLKKSIITISNENKESCLDFIKGIKKRVQLSNKIPLNLKIGDISMKDCVICENYISILLRIKEFLKKNGLRDIKFRIFINTTQSKGSNLLYL
ncbi:hypothetical protein ACWNYH_00025 [Candidatus Vidania fulgoroideorum]